MGAFREETIQPLQNGGPNASSLAAEVFARNAMVVEQFILRLECDEVLSVMGNVRLWANFAAQGPFRDTWPWVIINFIQKIG